MGLKKVGWDVTGFHVVQASCLRFFAFQAGRLGYMPVKRDAWATFADCPARFHICYFQQEFPCGTNRKARSAVRWGAS